MKKMYCSANEQETRFAVMEQRELVELIIERADERSILGNIYLGRVDSIHKGMEYAFVDIGIGKNAFLRETDVEKLLQGQYILVQVKKEDTNGKGVRVTTNIEFSGTYLVYMPFDNTVAVSRKIKGSDWKQIGQTWCEESEGIIFRSSCEGVSREVVEEEFKKYKQLFNSFQSLKKKVTLAYEPTPSYIQYVQNTSHIENIEVDNMDIVTKLREYVPIDKVIHYREKENIFSKYLIDIEIQKSLAKKVELENGIYLLFEQLETMTVIDVNSGNYHGKGDKETIAFEINTLACKEIIRQLKIRNIGGMICIDFINMKKSVNQKSIRQMIINATLREDVKYNIYDFTRLGLFEMTRERTGKTLQELMTSNCSVCNGVGRVISAQEKAHELIRRLAERNDDVVVEVTEDLLPYVKNKYEDIEFIVIEHTHSMFYIKNESSTVLN